MIAPPNETTNLSQNLANFSYFQSPNMDKLVYKRNMRANILSLYLACDIQTMNFYNFTRKFRIQPHLNLQYLTEIPFKNKTNGCYHQLACVSECVKGKKTHQRSRKIGKTTNQLFVEVLTNLFLYFTFRLVQFGSVLVQFSTSFSFIHL